MGEVSERLVLSGEWYNAHVPSQCVMGAWPLPDIVTSRSISHFSHNLPVPSLTLETRTITRRVAQYTGDTHKYCQDEPYYASIGAFLPSNHQYHNTARNSITYDHTTYTVFNYFHLLSPAFSHFNYHSKPQRSLDMATVAGAIGILNWGGHLRSTFVFAYSFSLTQ